MEIWAVLAADPKVQSAGKVLVGVARILDGFATASGRRKVHLDYQYDQSLIPAPHNGLEAIQSGVALVARGITELRRDR